MWNIFFPWMVHYSNVNFTSHFYRLILLSIKFNDNRSNHNNYECTKAIRHCVLYTPKILTKSQLVNKY